MIPKSIYNNFSLTNEASFIACVVVLFLGVTLRQISRGELVFLEYINGVIPDLMIKWTKGSTQLIHMATTRFTTFTYQMHSLILDSFCCL
jgi:hypothetical protein